MPNTGRGCAVLVLVPVHDGRWRLNTIYLACAARASDRQVAIQLAISCKPLAFVYSARHPSRSGPSSSVFRGPNHRPSVTLPTAYRCASIFVTKVPGLFKVATTSQGASAPHSSDIRGQVGPTGWPSSYRHRLRGPHPLADRRAQCPWNPRPNIAPARPTSSNTSYRSTRRRSRPITFLATRQYRFQDTSFLVQH